MKLGRLDLKKGDGRGDGQEKSEGRATGAMGYLFGSDVIQEKRRRVGGRRGREGAHRFQNL